MAFKLPPFSEIRKFAVSAVGAVAELVSLGVLHGTALQVATGIIAVATAIGVYQVPNVPPAKPVVAAPETSA